MMPPRGLIITGTDTGVGKTYIAAEILRAVRETGRRVGAYKPVVSGARQTPEGPVWDDIEILKEALGRKVPDEQVAPQRFLAPLAPPVAARLEGRSVDTALLRRGIEPWLEQADFIVVEGAGGLLSPLTETETLADVARDLKWPLLLVARLSLGTINHTLLTLEAAARRNLPVAGVVLNESVPADPHDISPTTNPPELQQRCAVPVLGVVRHNPAGGLLHESPLYKIAWWELAGRWQGV
ncbi:MAG: dethiobiotin synthase [Planctomycetes bacterium]|nr:dethiobiotin synthase [Planctomycetota bacterium]